MKTSITGKSSNSALFLGQEEVKINFNMGQSDFCDNTKGPQDELSNSRIKVKINVAKKRFLVKLTQKATEQRNEQILQQRRKALSNFRIDFMPLCCEEDLEFFAAAYKQDQQQKSEKNS